MPVEIGVVAQQIPLVGVVAEDVDRRRHLVAGGIGAGQQHGRDQQAQLAGVESGALVLGPDQAGGAVTS